MSLLLLLRPSFNLPTSIDSNVRGSGSSYRTVIKAHRQVRLQKLPVQNPYKKHTRSKPTWLV